MSRTLGADRTHGRVATYNAGCRCEDCTAAKSAAKQRTRVARHPGYRRMERVNGSGHWWRCPCGRVVAASRGRARRHHRTCQDAK